MAANLQDDDALHGIPMDEEAFERLVNGETQYRYELIDGVAYDMTGSSTEEHACIAGNLSAIIHAHLRQKGAARVYHHQLVKILWCANSGGRRGGDVQSYRLGERQAARDLQSPESLHCC